MSASIPPRLLARCDRCNDPVNVDSPGVAQYVTGWAVNRTAGGANQIALRSPQPRWLCRGCLDILRGGHDQQESLW